MASVFFWYCVGIASVSPGGGGREGKEEVLYWYCFELHSYCIGSALLFYWSCICSVSVLYWVALVLHISL